MSDFKGRKFEIIVITTYLSIFQLKPIVKTDDIHNFTEISSFSQFKVEICSSRFQIGDSFSSLMSHTNSYCFSTYCIYLTPVPSSEQIIALFKSLRAFSMPECYTHTYYLWYLSL